MDQIWLGLAGVLVVAVATALYFTRRNAGGGTTIEAPTPSREPVRHAPAPLAATPSPATPAMNATMPSTAIAAPDATAGDFLVTLGADEGLEAFADWLESEVVDELGPEAEEPLATTRIAEAARKALPAILTDGVATIDLPYLVADASGPKSFRRAVTRTDLVRALTESYAFDIRELMTWMAEDRAAVALGLWLMEEASGETGEDLEMVPAAGAALVEAAHDAAALAAESGHAVVDLPALAIDEERTARFHRVVDGATMQAALRLLEQAERDDA